MIVQNNDFYKKLAGKIQYRLTKSELNEEESKRFALEFVKEIHRLHIAIDNITRKAEDLLILLNSNNN